MNAQLARVRLASPPCLNYNMKVMVKCKWWHKLKTKGIASPFQEAVIKGPSPLMSHGWVVLTKKGSTQHARAVLAIDPDADKAMLELVESPTKPTHRLTEKTSLTPKVPHPSLVDPLDFSALETTESTVGGAMLAEVEDDGYEPSILPDDAVPGDLS